MKPYFGERGIRKIVMLCLSDSLRVNGRDIFATGNFIYFKGIKLYIQPPDQKDQKNLDNIPASDLVWLHFKSTIIDYDFISKTKIVLYTNRGEPERFKAKYPAQNFLAIDQSVRLSLDKSNQGSKNEMICKYFK
jgi:hypothetical protein